MEARGAVEAAREAEDVSAAVAVGRRGRESTAAAAVAADGNGWIRAGTRVDMKGFDGRMERLAVVVIGNEAGGGEEEEHAVAAVAAEVLSEGSAVA